MINFELSIKNAVPKPPLGPILGQNNINADSFIKQFNQAAKIYKQESLLQVKVLKGSGKNFQLKVYPPKKKYAINSCIFFIRSLENPQNTIINQVKLVSCRQLWEIALKYSRLYEKSPISIYKSLIGHVYSMDIKVIIDL